MNIEKLMVDNSVGYLEVANSDAMQFVPTQTAIRIAKEYAEESQKTLEEVFEVIKSAPELNMGNYSEDQVEELNNAMIEAFGIISQSGLIKTVLATDKDGE